MDTSQEPPTVDVDVDEAPEPRLPLSEDEQRVLELYDKLLQLRLEIAIVKAQQTSGPPDGRHSPDDPSDDSQEHLLNARAKFGLRHEVVEAVMMAGPILKAVHNSTDASPVERDLFPWLQQRDEAASLVAKQASELASLQADLTKLQADATRLSSQNVKLAATLFDLAERVKQKQAVAIDDADAQEEMMRLKDEVRLSRQRWRVVKGLASGVIAGSGVDWAHDEDLRAVVLDPANEE